MELEKCNVDSKKTQLELPIAVPTPGMFTSFICHFNIKCDLCLDWSTTKKVWSLSKVLIC